MIFASFMACRRINVRRLCATSISMMLTTFVLTRFDLGVRAIAVRQPSEKRLPYAPPPVEPPVPPELLYPGPCPDAVAGVAQRLENRHKPMPLQELRVGV